MRTDWNPPAAPKGVRHGEPSVDAPSIDAPSVDARPVDAPSVDAPSIDGPSGKPVSLGYRTLRAIDPVTGLGNARCWSQRAVLLQCDAYWRQEPIALLAVDIDQFARINDEYGHPAGDDVLRSVGEELRRAIRPSDLVCRCLADEFLILAPGRDAEAALELGTRIRDRVRLLVTSALASVDWLVTITDVTVSVGIAVGNDLATDELLGRARGALEHIKSYGHDMVCLADPGAASDRSLTRQGLSATTCRLD